MCHLHHHHHLHHHRRHKNSPPPPDAMKPITRSAAAKKLKDQTVTPNTATKKKRKQSTGSVSLKPACKSRTKRRRPKYLSLNSKLDQHKKPQRSSKKNTKMTANKTRLHPQLTLFPLHPEHLVEDSKHDMHEHDDNNVVASFLFDTATDTSTTLNGLLTSTTSEQESPAASPLSLTFAYSKDRSGGDSNGLVRTAMRCKERDASEEKWVCYSEVVENKIKEEEVMSSSCTDDRDDVDEGSWCMKQVQGQQQKKKKLLLSLKLDYQEILNAWSDKGPLYIDGESPQTVPDLHDANVPMDAWSNVNGNLWSVPEMTSNDSSFNKVSDEGGCKEGWSREHREASVLRYKEKRQSRLFSKRIRYEVRKLNAEKRPRMKGRFVKRNSEL